MWFTGAAYFFGKNMADIESISKQTYIEGISGIVVPIDYGRVTTEFFMHRGWNVARRHKDAVDRQGVILGSEINCADNRRDQDSPLAYAWWGGIHGFLQFIDPLKPIGYRYQKAVEVIEDAFFKAGDHEGCKLVHAALEGKVPELKGLTAEDVLKARELHNIGSQKLNPNQVSTGVLLNCCEGCTVVPHGEFHSVDPLAAFRMVEKLGVCFENVLQICERNARLIFPKGGNLYIV